MIKLDIIRIPLLFVFVLSLGFSGFSQKKNGGTSLLSELNISIEQQQSIQNIKDGLIDIINNNTFNDKSKTHAAVKGAKRQFINDLNKILTPDQRDKVKSQRQHEIKLTKKDRANIAAYKVKAQLASQEYHQNYIQSVVQNQRIKLKSYISAQDQDVLDKLNYQMGKATNQLDQPGKKYHFAIQNGKILMNQTDHNMLNVLAEKYRMDIETVLEEISEAHSVWMADLEWIRAQEKPEIMNKIEANKPFHFYKSMLLKTLNLKLSNVARFLLWNPQSIQELAGEVINEPLLTVFPNPATSQQQLNFTLVEDGRVTIELMDMMGRTVKNVYSGLLSKGSQTINVEMGDLSPNSYVYRVTSPMTTRTYSIIIQ